MGALAKRCGARAVPSGQCEVEPQFWPGGDAGATPSGRRTTANDRRLVYRVLHAVKQAARFRPIREQTKNRSAWQRSCANKPLVGVHCDTAPVSDLACPLVPCYWQS
jgi:hypothetical protein